MYYLLATLCMIVASLMPMYKELQLFNVASNIMLYNLLALCTVLFIGVYFRKQMHSALKRKLIIGMIFFYVAYVIIKNFFLKEYVLFDSLGYSFVSAIVTVYVFMFFHQVLNNVTEESILTRFDFWLSAGYLINFLGSFIIFLSYYYFTRKILATYTTAERELVTALWGVHNVLLFVSALSLLIGSIWLTYRNRSI